MWTRLKNIKFEGSTRYWVVLLLVLIEATYAVVLWSKTTPIAENGYLLKNGQRYIIAWRYGEDDFDTAVFKELDRALAFSQELGLEVRTTSWTSHEVEYLSMADRFGAYELIWKVSDVGFLNQLSFYSKPEAEFFAGAIRRGAYTPSPFGHSLLLSRALNQ